MKTRPRYSYFTICFIQKYGYIVGAIARLHDDEKRILKKGPPVAHVYVTGSDAGTCLLYVVQDADCDAVAVDACVSLDS